MALASTPLPAAPEADQLYALIADTIPHMVWTARADGWHDFFNRRCYEYTGLAYADLAGWSWRQIIHPDDRECAVASWTRALQTGERCDVESRMRRADGAHRWHHVSAVATRDAQGRVARWFGTCTDIESEVRSAQILEGMVEERTRALSAILDTEPECVKLLDSEGRLLQMNAAGLRMLEAESVEPLLRQCVYAFVVPEHRQAFRDLTERVCRGERGTLEFEIVGLRGTRRWMETHAVPFREDASGETRLLAITRDISGRKRTEQALRESEARFRSLTALSSDFYWETDADYRFTRIDYGPHITVVIPVAQQLGKRRWEVPVVSPGEAGWAAHRADIAARRPFYDFEFSRPIAGGERFYRASGEPTFAPDGSFTGYRGIGRDITERKLADAERRRLEQALRHTESRFEAFMDHLPAQAWIRDRHFRYRYVNRVYARAHGMEPAAIVGREPGDFFPPETERHFRGTDLKVLDTGGPLQWVDAQPYGHWLKVKFPLPGADGEAAVAGIAIDVTERVRLEEALRHSEQRFRSFMENVPARAWIKDAEFRYVYINQAFERGHGHEASAVLGKTDFDLFPVDVAQRFRSDDAEVLRAGIAVQSVRHIATPRVDLGDWLVVKFPFPDVSGRMGIAGIAIDVNERVQAEDRAQRFLESTRSLMKRLVAAQESERRRIADDLHDLIGQNLTALGIGLATLKAHPSAEVREAVTPRVDTMSVLVEGTIAAIRGVMAELRPAALEELGLVPALRWYASVFTGQTGMPVSVGASGQERRLSREVELALFRIAQEALTNAAKHSGGTTASVTVAEAGPVVRMCIEDDGQGFSDRVGARQAQRGGWGLPAMRERAEALGGTLRVEFPPRGTRVVVEMPARHAD